MRRNVIPSTTRHGLVPSICGCRAHSFSRGVSFWMRIYVAKNNSSQEPPSDILRLIHGRVTAGDGSPLVSPQLLQWEPARANHEMQVHVIQTLLSAICDPSYFGRRCCQVTRHGALPLLIAFECLAWMFRDERQRESTRISPRGPTCSRSEVEKCLEMRTLQQLSDSRNSGGFRWILSDGLFYLWQLATHLCFFRWIMRVMG